MSGLSSVGREMLMNDQPPTVGPLGEHDRLHLMNRFFACVGSFTAVYGVRQDGRIAEHLEFHHASIDRQRNRQDVVLCRPFVPRSPVLVQRTEPVPAVDDRRLVSEVGELGVPPPFAEARHQSLIRVKDFALHGSTPHPSFTRFLGRVPPASCQEYVSSVTRTSPVPTTSPSGGAMPRKVDPRGRSARSWNRSTP